MRLSNAQATFCGVAILASLYVLTGTAKCQAQDAQTHITKLQSILTQMDQLFASIDARKGGGPSAATHRFQYYYNFDPKGERYWSQISPTEWQEKYATGETTKFRITGRTTVEGDHGITAAKQDGSGLVVFIPDKGGKQMWLRFRAGDQGNWNLLGEMTHIE